MWLVEGGVVRLEARQDDDEELPSSWVSRYLGVHAILHRA